MPHVHDRNIVRRASFAIRIKKQERIMYSPMAKADGSMTFDWIFIVIVGIPMIFAAWELYKSYKILDRLKPRHSGR